MSTGTDLREGDMIRFLIGFLTARGYMIWRAPNYGYFDRERFKKMYIKDKKPMDLALNMSYAKVYGILKGVPDVIGFSLVTGKFIGVEIKIGSDTLKPEQRDLLNALHKAGGEAYVARTKEQFVQAYEQRHSAPSPKS